MGRGLNACRAIWNHRWFLCALVLACACSHEAPPKRDAAAEVDAAVEMDAAAKTDAAPEVPPPPEAAPFDMRRCEGMKTLDHFGLIPSTPNPPIFSYADTSCGRTPASLLIVNATAKTVRINEIGVSPAILDSDSAQDASANFAISAASLPRELGPQEAMSIQMEFRARNPYVSAMTSIVVATPEGCQILGPVTGVRHNVETGVGFAPLAIDFGVFRPGEVGPIIDVDFMYRRGSGASTFHLDIQGSMPSDVFRVVEPFSGDVSNECTNVVLQMQMTAPSTPGPVDGFLFLEIQSDGSSGLGTISLRGLVRE